MNKLLKYLNSIRVCNSLDIGHYAKSPIKRNISPIIGVFPRNYPGKVGSHAGSERWLADADARGHARGRGHGCDQLFCRITWFDTLHHLIAGITGDIDSNRCLTAAGPNWVARRSSPILK